MALPSPGEVATQPPELGMAVRTRAPKRPRPLRHPHHVGLDAVLAASVLVALDDEVPSEPRAASLSSHSRTNPIDNNRDRNFSIIATPSSQGPTEDQSSQPLATSYFEPTSADVALLGLQEYRTQILNHQTSNFRNPGPSLALHRPRETFDGGQTAQSAPTAIKIITDGVTPCASRDAAVASGDNDDLVVDHAGEGTRHTKKVFSGPLKTYGKSGGAQWSLEWKSIKYKDRYLQIESDGHSWRLHGKKNKVDGQWVKYYYTCAHRNESRQQLCKAKKHLMHAIENPTKLYAHYAGEHSHG